jgi:hypothetical protein
MKLRDFRLPGITAVYLRELEVKGVLRRQIEVMLLAQALCDYVSGTGIEVVDIETVLGFAPNYGLTTMAVLRSVIELRSRGHIGMFKFNGKLESVVPNPALFSSTACVRGVADQQIAV